MSTDAGSVPVPYPPPSGPSPGGWAAGDDETHIHDQGFRRYEGSRTGVAGAVRSLVVHSIRQSLGLGRSARYKLVPLPILAMAFIPAVGLVAMAALLPVGTEEFLPTYAEYYGLVAATIYLFAGLIAPELLCTDQRTGMLGVYLASPLDRLRYLLAKALAVFLLLLFITLGPPLLMLIAFSLQNLGPDGFTAWVKVFLQIVASSAVVGVLYGAVGMAISASTDRRVVASAAILSVIPGSAIVTDILVGDGDLTPWLRLLNVMFLPRAIVFRIHGERGGWPVSENPTWSLWLAFAAWLVVCATWIWYRYRRLLVRR